MSEASRTLLSKCRAVHKHLVMDDDISSETEQVRYQLESGGELSTDVINHYSDVRGEPVRPDTPLYREKDTGKLLTGRSCFRCRGCYAFFRVDLGKEITEPLAEFTQPPDPEGLNSVDPSTVLAVRLPAEDRPRSGYCEPCWKQEKRKRLFTAIRNFLLKPFMAMTRSDGDIPAERPEQLPAPTTLYPRNNQARRRSKTPGSPPNAGDRLYPRQSKNTSWSTS